MATTLTAGPVLSNVASPASTSSAAWLLLWTLTRPIQCRKIQIINDGSSTGAAQVSLGDDNNPLYIPAGGSLSLEDITVVGPIKIKRDASTDLVSAKVQLWLRGGGVIETR